MARARRRTSQCVDAGGEGEGGGDADDRGSGRASAGGRARGSAGRSRRSGRSCPGRCGATTVSAPRRRVSDSRIETCPAMSTSKRCDLAVAGEHLAARRRTRCRCCRPSPRRGARSRIEPPTRWMRRSRARPAEARRGRTRDRLRRVHFLAARAAPEEHLRQHDQSGAAARRLAHEALRLVEVLALCRSRRTAGWRRRENVGSSCRDRSFRPARDRRTAARADAAKLSEGYPVVKLPCRREPVARACSRSRPSVLDSGALDAGQRPHRPLLLAGAVGGVIPPSQAASCVRTERPVGLMSARSMPTQQKPSPSGQTVRKPQALRCPEEPLHHARRHSRRSSSRGRTYAWSTTRAVRTSPA